MAEQPTFLLTGTYSSANKGDAAMQVATAQVVKEAWPGAEVILGAPFTEMDRPFYPDLTVVPATRRRLIWGSLQVARAWLFQRLSRLGLNIRPLIGNDELQAFHRSSLVIDLSGDMLTEDYGVHVTYSHFLPFLIAMAFDKPILVCAQSIGPFKITRPLARFVLGRVTRITVRDEITLGLLQDAGISRTDVTQTADMAFLLRTSDSQEVDALLKRDEVQWPSGKVLGVSVSGLIDSHYRKGHPNARDGQFPSEMARLLDRAVEELDAQIVFVSHVTGPKANKDDRRMARKVHERMSHKDRAICLPGDYRPEELKGLISRCYVFMGARMHANIAALSSGVPVIALAYSHKTPGILRLFELEKASCPVRSFEVDEGWELLQDSWHRREEISENMLRCLVNVKERSRSNLDSIREALDSAER